MYPLVLLISAIAPGAPVPDDVVRPPADIQCQDQAKYIGGIDRAYSLVISGPKEKTWKYTFEMLPGLEKRTLAGTYELADGLAIFTGKVNGKEDVRFGLNYGLVNGQIGFNGFFPVSGESLAFSRRWYAQEKGVWKPARQVTIEMARVTPAGEEWKVGMNVERIVWDATGQPKRERHQDQVSYRFNGAAYTRQAGAKKELEGIVPDVLVPRLEQGKLQAVLLGLTGGPDGFLRGFSPEIARAP